MFYVMKAEKDMRQQPRERDRQQRCCEVDDVQPMGRMGEIVQHRRHGDDTHQRQQDDGDQGMRAT